MRDLSLHLMDIIQNSISADAARIDIRILVNSAQDELKIEVTDNGRGMDKELLAKVSDPFSTTRTTRRIGLGIPLFRASAQRTGGDLTVDSDKGKGTTVTALLKIRNIDRPPLGDIAETVVNVIAAKPEIQWNLFLDNIKEEFVFDSNEVKSRLGDVPINQFEVLTWIKEFINEAITRIFGGELDEIIG